jgi:electron transfer flavoprotein alpha subunit
MAGRVGKTIVSDLPPSDLALRDLGPADDFSPPKWRPLSKARRIVAVGRGLGDIQGVELARQLAERLGAEFAGDRSARDAGWVDEAHEVGVTAQEVAPDLYLALGIFGDTVHNAAIAGAKRVVAVHMRPDAPIFASADEAVVAEPVEMVRALLRAT